MADDNTSTTTTTDDTGQPATDPGSTGQDKLGEGGRAALDRERATARDAERARKTAEKALQAATAQLEQLRQSSMSDQEKAVSKAREDGKAEARQSVLKEVGGRLVDAHLTAALAGRMDDEQRSALLDGLDRTRFLTGDGDVDVKALTAWVDRVAPVQAGRPPLPDRSQGRGSEKKVGSMDQLIRQAAGVTTR